MAAGSKSFVTSASFSSPRIATIAKVPKSWIIQLHAGYEIACGYGLILAALWTSSRSLQLLWMALAASVILFFSVLRQRHYEHSGLRLPSLVDASWTMGIGMAMAGILVVAGKLMGLPIPANPGWPPPHDLLDYAIWALVQQFILQSFFFVRLEELVGSARAVIVTALLFSAAHLPNPVLTVATFLGALFFCEMFRRYRSIYPLGLAHALLGITIALTIPNFLLHHMRVGIGYLHFQ
jgi:membrane protease YdiL (CAAX protease family)